MTMKHYAIYDPKTKVVQSIVSTDNKDIVKDTPNLVEVPAGTVIDQPDDWVYVPSTGKLKFVGRVVQPDEVETWVNEQLASSDWTQFPDSPLSADDRAAWAAYRDALRKFKVSYKPVKKPAWPTPPTGKAAYAVIMNDRLNQYAETQAARITRGRDRLAMTYLQKQLEARDVLATTNPVAADYPHLSVEVGVTAPDIVGVAKAVLAKAAAWSAANAQIELARQKFQAALKAASTNAGIDTAFSTARSSIDAAVTTLLAV